MVYISMAMYKLKTFVTYLSIAFNIIGILFITMGFITSGGFVKETVLIWIYLFVGIIAHVLLVKNRFDLKGLIFWVSWSICFLLFAALPMLAIILLISVGGIC